MFYICKKKEQSLGTIFGIMDTDDGVVEYYSPRDIIEFVRDRGIIIEGVQLNNQTGKWNFRVMKPTKFETTDTDSFSDETSSKLINKKVITNNSSEFLEFYKLYKLLYDKLKVMYANNNSVKCHSLNDILVYSDKTDLISLLNNFNFELPYDGEFYFSACLVSSESDESTQDDTLMLLRRLDGKYDLYPNHNNPEDRLCSGSKEDLVRYIDSGEIDNGVWRKIKSRVINGVLEIRYPEHWGALDDLSDKVLDKVFKPWKCHLDKLLSKLGIHRNFYLDYIDGCDCVGYDSLSIPNIQYTQCKMSIFTNPSYDTSENGLLTIRGIGVDISGVDGKSMDECHFECAICDDFVTNFKSWFSNLLVDSSGNTLTNNANCIEDFISLCKYAEKLLPRCDGLNYQVSVYSKDDMIGQFENGLDGLLSHDFDVSEVSRLESYFADGYFPDYCRECDDIAFLYLEYNLDLNQCRLYGDALCESAITAYESAGFPKGELKKHCKDGHYEVSGTYKEFINYITNILSNKDVLTQDSDCLKHFIEVAKKVDARFTELYRNNTLGIEMNQLLDISIMINGDDCFNLLAEPNFSVPCPNGYSLTKFVASLFDSEGYLMFGFDGNKYSVFVDACDTSKFGFRTTKEDNLLFFGEEQSLLVWLNKVVI